MARRNLEGVDISDCTFKQGNRMGIMNQTLGADFVMSNDSTQIVVLDANGAARNVRLPPNPQRGDYYIILNPAAGAFALTLQTGAGAALSPAVTVAQNKACVVFWTGTAWKALSGA